YEAFAVASFALFIGPLIAILSVANYILVSSHSLGLIIATRVVSAIAAFVLACAVPGLVHLALSFLDPMVVLSSGRLWFKGIGIPWSELSGIGLQRYSLQPFVAIELRSPRSFLESLPNYVSSFWRLRFRRTQNRLIVPAARGLTILQLRDLIQSYWEANRVGAARMEAERAITFDGRPSQTKTIAMLATAAFVAAIYVQWFAVIDFIRDDDAWGAFVAILLAVGAGAVACGIAAVVLRAVKRIDPSFDLFEKVGVVQQALFGNSVGKER
ncbi:MAG TPA: hypothetical protein VJP76_09300, partial [Candidatus Tumulicola sp.]|nr:hypothetical protein [Candidatus Tumulicola sp.]